LVETRCLLAFSPLSMIRTTLQLTINVEHLPSVSNTPPPLTLRSKVVTICTNRLSLQQFYVLPTHYIDVFCVDLRTNSDYFPIQHYLTGFYNRDGVCLLRGTDWIFKFSSGQWYFPQLRSKCQGITRKDGAQAALFPDKVAKISPLFILNLTLNVTILGSNPRKPSSQSYVPL
jgi:hypothetical protein